MPAYCSRSNVPSGAKVFSKYHFLRRNLMRDVRLEASHEALVPQSGVAAARAVVEGLEDADVCASDELGADLRDRVLARRSGRLPMNTPCFTMVSTTSLKQHGPAAPPRATSGSRRATCGIEGGRSWGGRGTVAASNRAGGAGRTYGSRRRSERPSASRRPQCAASRSSAGQRATAVHLVVDGPSVHDPPG